LGDALAHRLRQSAHVGDRARRNPAGITRSIAFYKIYVGEGSLPCGVHDPNTRLLASGRWKRMYDQMIRSVEGGEPEKLVPFEEAGRQGNS
jgi:hypothetical protein